MSKRESDDLGMSGYFLPEDGQLRLAKLRDHITFLARLAQPHTWDEEREWAPEVPVGELSICLELLAEQADLVLGEMSRSARRQVVTSATEYGAAPVSPEVSGTEDERFAFGITMDQVDALDRLIQAISAYGDVVAAGRTAELADHTLPLMGQAIHDAAAAVRAILDAVEAQRPGPGARSRTGVGEGRCAYRARLVCLVGDSCRVCHRPYFGHDRGRVPFRSPCRSSESLAVFRGRPTSRGWRHGRVAGSTCACHQQGSQSKF